MEDLQRIVWLASYPKSGNTWLRVFLANLTGGGTAPADINRLEVLSSSDRALFDTNSGLASSDLTSDEISRLRPDVFRFASRHRARARTSEPLLVKTHEAFAMTPDGLPLFPPDVTRAAVYIVRNPLDVAVSLAHHTGVTPAEAVRRMGDDDPSSKPQPSGCQARLPENWSSWSRNVSSWTSRDDLPLTVMRYEEMHANPFETFAKAAAAVAPGSTAEQIERAIERSRFDLLAKQEEIAGFRERPPDTPRFFRKGVVGSWRGELGSREIDAVIEKHGPMMARFGYL